MCYNASLTAFASTEFKDLITVYLLPAAVNKNVEWRITGISLNN